MDSDLLADRPLNSGSDDVQQPNWGQWLVLVSASRRWATAMPVNWAAPLPLGTASADAISKLGRPRLHFWDAFVRHPSVICVISKTTVVQRVTSVLDDPLPGLRPSTDNLHSAREKGS
jgi:hypothetical protein